MNNPLFKNVVNLTKLPSELLIIIFGFVDTRDLINLMRTHTRFQQICSDKLFWKNVIDPPDEYDTLEKIINKYIHDETHTFKISSVCHGSNPGLSYSSFPPSLLSNLSQTSLNLTHLYLIRQKIDGHFFRIADLPKRLQVFHLTNSSINVDTFTSIPNEEHPYDIEACQSYFKGIESHLVYLEDLDLSFCSWIMAMDLIHLRKLNKLIRLSLKGCRFHDVPKTAYVDSAATRRLQWMRVFSAIAQSGFDNLKVFDLNNTDINRNQFLESFFRNRRKPLLEELYIGYYDLEYIRPLMDYRLNSSPLQHAVNLKILDVSGFVVDDTLVTHLNSNPLLEKLLMYFTTVSDETVAILRLTISKVYTYMGSWGSWLWVEGRLCYKRAKLHPSPHRRPRRHKENNVLLSGSFF